MCSLSFLFSSYSLIFLFLFYYIYTIYKVVYINYLLVNVSRILEGKRNKHTDTHTYKHTVKVGWAQNRRVEVEGEKKRAKGGEMSFGLKEHIYNNIRVTWSVAVLVVNENNKKRSLESLLSWFYSPSNGPRQRSVKWVPREGQGKSCCVLMIRLRLETTYVYIYRRFVLRDHLWWTRNIMKLEID